MTERAEYIFVVKEYEGGKPWLMLDLLKGADLPLLKDHLLGFDLKEGTTLEQAKDLANRLNQSITTLASTDLSKI